MNTNHTAPPPKQETIHDTADSIGSAISVLHDLLKLAFQECPAEVESPSKAGALILAAGRYVDDVATLNARLYARQFSVPQAEHGGAA